MSTLKPQRAVIYARVSTSDQVDGTSLDTQQAWCRAQVNSLGWQFIDDYVDAGLSGADSNRPQWQRLLTDAREGRFDAVFVYDLDRFTRDMLHGLQATRQLRDLGISLHDAKNPLTDVASIDSQLMTGVRLLIAEEERRAIKERTVRGQRAKLAAGQWAGGKPSYGWRLEGIRTRHAYPVPDVQERENLRIMYSLLTHDQLSTGEVCERLAELGIESRNGGRWSHTVLKRVMSNPTLHTGWFIWGEPKGGSTDGRSHKTKINKEGKAIYGEPTKVYLPDPPFSREEFRAVQRAFARHPRANKPQAEGVPRLLTGRVFGECGKHYTGTSLSGKDYAIYRCTGNRHRGRNAKHERCGCHQLNAQKLEKRVWDEVAKFLERPDRLVGMAMKWLEISEEDSNDDAQLRLTTTSERASKLERAIQKLEDELYLTDSAEPARLRDRLARFQAELSTLQDQQRNLKEYLETSAANAARLESLSALAFHAGKRLHSLTALERREVIHLLNIQVFISNVTSAEPASLTMHGLMDPKLFEGTEHWRRFPSFEFEIGPEVH